MVTPSRIKPNRRPAPGPIGNTTGIILPDTAPNPKGNSAPTIKPTEKEKGWWDRWGSSAVHIGLDVVGLIPGVGEIADGANALIYLAEGDKVNAALSAAAMVPGLGMAATGAKYGKKAVGVAVEAGAKTVREGTEKVVKEGAEAGTETVAKKGGKDLGDPRCILRPFFPDTCKPTRTGHHVVPDRVFRTGKRGSGRIPGGVSEADGLVICVDGANASRSKEHGQIHALYDPAEAAAGLLGNPPGTTKLGLLEAAGAIATAKITGCNALLLEAQLRAYHQAKGLGFDTIVRADPTGKLPVIPSSVGLGAVPPRGATR